MVFKFLSKDKKKGKKSEFFLEAPPLSHEADPAAQFAEVKQEVQKAAEAAVDQVKETVAKVAGAVEEKLDKAAPAVTPEAKPAATKTKKLKKSKSTAKTESETDSKAERPKPAALAQPAPEPVKNFATDFLMPSATPRRRPGPSMNMFRDMAKDVNPRK